MTRPGVEEIAVGDIVVATLERVADGPKELAWRVILSQPLIDYIFATHTSKSIMYRAKTRAKAIKWTEMRVNELD